MAGRGVEFCWVEILVVATMRCVSTLMVVAVRMMSLDWRTYPLPSSLALREKMLAKENMVAEENIFAEVGIDAVIRIIVAGIGWLFALGCIVE